MRENAEVKSRRLLVEGRVYVVRVSGAHVDAVVRGDTELHHVCYDGGAWSCTCAAVTHCSHIRALQLVTVPTGAWVVGQDMQVQVGGRSV